MVYISLGAGVQSSALLVMAVRGLHGCPKADFAVFADTQDEPEWVYQHLNQLSKWVYDETGDHYFIRSVTAGRLADETLGLTGKKRRAALPVFTLGEDGRAAILPRQCTEEYKLAPIRKRLRVELGIPRPPAGAVTALIGISFDERHRIADSRRRWIVNRYPLVDAVLRRHDCARILEGVGLPVPRKSACIYCPFHNDTYWLDLRTTEPRSFERACQFDEAVRDSSRRGLRSPVYLHRSLQPLRDVPLDTAQDELDGFGNDCSGSCGV